MAGGRGLGAGDRGPVVGGRWPVVGGRWPVAGGRWLDAGGRMPVVGWWSGGEDANEEKTMDHYFIGLDLGQSQDFTALAILERAEA